MVRGQSDCTRLADGPRPPGTGVLLERARFSPGRRQAFRAIDPEEEDAPFELSEDHSGTGERRPQRSQGLASLASTSRCRVYLRLNHGRPFRTLARSLCPDSCLAFASARDAPGRSWFARRARATRSSPAARSGALACPCARTTPACCSASAALPSSSAIAASASWLSHDGARLLHLAARGDRLVVVPAGRGHVTRRERNLPQLVQRLGSAELQLRFSRQERLFLGFPGRGDLPLLKEQHPQFSSPHHLTPLVADLDAGGE